ncbi:hypothetical protein ACOSP6_02955 [Tenacibaculum sp. MEBiC06402]|uniref:hypothetical protein n=1 Tax=unclassified Tenacibaculum TaxID=2635139 RepID=UPI003B9934A7
MTSKINYFFVLFVMIAILSSCEDTVLPSNIKTRVFGRMYDAENDLPVVNKKLRIGEYNTIPGFGTFPNIEFIRYVDSVYTDSNGYYDVTFETSGDGDRYTLEIDFNSDDNFSLLNYPGYPTRIEKLGEENELNFDALFLFPVQLKITLAPDVQFLPIRIDKPYFRPVNNLNETGVEITRLFYIDKNSDWQVMLKRETNDGQRQRVLIDMNATNSSDLTEFEFNINNEDFVDY